METFDVPLRNVTYNGVTYPLAAKGTYEPDEDYGGVTTVVLKAPEGYPRTPLVNALYDDKWAYIVMETWFPSIDRIKFDSPRSGTYEAPPLENPCFAHLRSFYNDVGASSIRETLTSQGKDTAECDQMRGLGREMMCKVLKWISIHRPPPAGKTPYIVLEASGGKASAAKVVQMRNVPMRTMLEEFAIRMPIAAAELALHVVGNSMYAVEHPDSRGNHGYFPENIRNAVIAWEDNTKLVKYYEKAFGFSMWQGGTCDIRTPQYDPPTPCVTPWTFMGGRFDEAMHRCEDVLSKEPEPPQVPAKEKRASRSAYNLRSRHHAPST